MSDPKEKFLELKVFAMDYFSPERFIKVMDMFRHFGQRLLEAPQRRTSIFIAHIRVVTWIML